jgi:tetratricopeptide (TPR) repeat protein
MNIEKLLEQAIEAAGRVERPAIKSADYVSIAAVYLDNGQRERCLEVLKLAAAQAERIKLPVEKAVCLAYIGGLYQSAGESSGSKQYFTRAVLLARAVETPDGQVKALTEISREYAGTGLPEETAGVLEKIYALVKDPQNGLDKAFELTNIAEIYVETGKPEMAGKILNEALASSLEIKDNWFKVERLIGIAEVHDAMKDTAGVIEILERVKPFLLDLEEVDRADFWLRIGAIYRQADDKLRAVEALKAARESIQANIETNYQVENLVETAVEYLALGERLKTLELLEYSVQKNVEVEDFSDKISGLSNISEVLGWSGEKGRAMETAEQAMGLCNEHPDKKETLYLLGNLAVVYTGLGEKAKAAKVIDTICTIALETRVKTSGLGAIAVDLAEAGDIEGAIRLIGLVNDPHIKAESLTGIVEKMIKSGKT